MRSWTRYGDCTHCGHCCEVLARVPVVRSLEQVGRDRAFYEARGFTEMVVDGTSRWVLFAWATARCPELVDMRCRIHDAKPETCRTFPRVPSDVVGTPCSYWFEDGSKKFGGTGSPYPTDEALFLRWEASVLR